MRLRYENEKRDQKLKNMYDVILDPFMTEPLKYGFWK